MPFQTASAATTSALPIQYGRYGAGRPMARLGSDNNDKYVRSIHAIENVQYMYIGHGQEWTKCKRDMNTRCYKLCVLLRYRHRLVNMNGME